MGASPPVRRDSATGPAAKTSAVAYRAAGSVACALAAIDFNGRGMRDRAAAFRREKPRQQRAERVDVASGIGDAAGLFRCHETRSARDNRFGQVRACRAEAKGEGGSG